MTVNVSAPPGLVFCGIPLHAHARNIDIWEELHHPLSTAVLYLLRSSCGNTAIKHQRWHLRTRSSSLSSRGLPNFSKVMYHRALPSSVNHSQCGSYSLTVITCVGVCISWLEPPKCTHNINVLRMTVLSTE